MPEPSFSWAKLIASKDKEIDRLENAYASNLEKAKVEIVRDRAVIAGANTIKLFKSGETIKAKYILVATGGAPSIGKEIEGREHIISSNEAFHLTELPRRILIQGGGYVAEGDKFNLVQFIRQRLPGFHQQVGGKIPS